MTQGKGLTECVPGVLHGYLPLSAILEGVDVRICGAGY